VSSAVCFSFGFQPHICSGDVILSCNGKAVQSSRDVVSSLGLQAGVPLTLRIQRDASILDIIVVSEPERDD